MVEIDGSSTKTFKNIIFMTKNKNLDLQLTLKYILLLSKKYNSL